MRKEFKIVKDQVLRLQEFQDKTVIFIAPKSNEVVKSKEYGVFDNYEDAKRAFDEIE